MTILCWIAFATVITAGIVYAFQHNFFEGID